LKAYICKSESSQSHESRTQSADSSKAYSKPGTFDSVAYVLAPASLASCGELALTEFFNSYPSTFCLLWHLTNSAYHQDSSLVFPTEIGYETEDKQHKHLSQCTKQTSTAIYRRILLCSTKAKHFI